MGLDSLIRCGIYILQNKRCSAPDSSMKKNFEVDWNKVERAMNITKYWFWSYVASRVAHHGPLSGAEFTKWDKGNRDQARNKNAWCWGLSTLTISSVGVQCRHSARFLGGIPNPSRQDPGFRGWFLGSRISDFDVKDRCPTTPVFLTK